MTFINRIIILIMFAVCVSATRSGCSNATIEKISDTMSIWTCTDYSDDSSECFVASTLVYDVNDNPFPMSKLKTGDWILDGDNTPTQVMGFMHNFTAFTRTIKVYAGKEMLVHLTPDHLLYNRDELIFADEFEHFDVIRLIDDSLRLFTRYENVTGTQHLMAPLTISGTIKVGTGMKASCYAYMKSQKLNHFYARVRNWVVPFHGKISVVETTLLSVLQALGFSR